MRRDNKRKRQRDKLLPGQLLLSREPAVRSATRRPMPRSRGIHEILARGRQIYGFFQSDIQQITRDGRCTRARFIAACFCHHSIRLVNHRCAFIDGPPLSDVWRGFFYR